MKRKSQRKQKPKAPRKRKPKTGTSHTDYSFPNPGAFDIVYCGVCGAEMAVQRNVLGPTSYAEAMLVRGERSKGHLHDAFHCAQREEP